MFPDPLHPAVVHFPVVLMLLVPAVALVAACLIALRVVRARAWILVVVCQVALVGSAWLALETGEDQEERVERVVAERWIEQHEESGQRFTRWAVVGLAVSFAGLLGGTAGTVGRGAAVLVALLVAGYGQAVGHSGGELVYRHGAALAYVDSTVVSGEAAREGTLDERPGHHDEDDDDD